MMNSLLIFIGKLLSKAVQTFNLGNGSTWPGHIALGINRNLIRELLRGSKIKVILIAGTNGKTTTSGMIRTVLERSGKKVLQNESGANLLNGIASTLLLHANGQGKLAHDYAIFEVDENTLPLLLRELTPDYLILLNLFRDQLDRYGEVDSIGRKWAEVLQTLSKETTIVLNADDPQIAFLGKGLAAKTVYFGLGKRQVGIKKLAHAADSIYCPNCGRKLFYRQIFFSHLGDWYCGSCQLKRPKIDCADSPVYPLSGEYNRYNTLASVLLFSEIGISQPDIEAGLRHFIPAFGRQEVIVFEGKKIQVFLSKNPTGFNESLRTAVDLGAKYVLLLLNDRVADGRDVSWIWDIDIEPFVADLTKIIVSGDRAYDLGLRIKYAMKDQSSSSKFQTFEKIDEAIKEGLGNLSDKDTLYILPTYTAMLEVRKILTGRKIL